ncbi:DUF167 domain-containing protein [Neptuniibacter sp. CAU 1671]|uniref:DUF167 domain-containing protein n=1 Tax=Neptuniibacter sp. CAU 1671 TaxID=3032593 RepID=UPI0023DA03A4|nr:DUF167 domain-containing protein [Neptuniibacter sp. CAU 1671]MDF2182390.1 DUF167 domain-containing protein [Neptuniibacter sp. CAU 1671]
MSWFQWQSQDLILSCHLQPNASRDEFAGLHGDSLKIRIKAPPVDGKANAHLVKYLAKQFGVAKNAVIIVKGELTREKRVKILAPKQIPDVLEIEIP